MSIKTIKNKYALDINDTNNFIKKNLSSEIKLINDISFYLTDIGGKRIRPILNIIFSKMLKNYTKQNTIMSSVVELIHTATLLHDDVVDLSDKRRGTLTVNNIWGNKEAILVGDFLYTKSFKMMTEIKNLELLKLMANTTNIMSEGEIKQLNNIKNFNITEEIYLDIIRCKTAELFAATTLSSAILANADYEIKIMAYKYGLHFGIAYQLIDDILDYLSSDEKFGKNICDDILNGTFTLPIIKFMNNDKKKKIIINTIIQQSDIDLFKIRDLIINSDALDYTYKLALYHIDKAKNALSIFNKSEFLNDALSLTDFIVNRKY